MNDSIAFLLFIVILAVTAIVYKNGRYKYVIAATSILASCIVYYIFQNRALYLGCLFGLCFLFALPFKKITRATLLILVAFFVSLFSILFLVKVNSSKGRLLIYKVTFTQLKTYDYVYGIGLGKFKATYNQLQANYFANHNINSEEALLAGNGYYLFNDWLQAALEIGLIGILILSICIFLFFKLYEWKPNNGRVLKAANAILICISVAAFFNYPLQVPLIFGSFIFSLILHFHYSYRLRQQFRYRQFVLLKNSLLIGVSLLSLYYCIYIYQYKRLSYQAYTLNRIGYKNEADSLFQKLDKMNFSDYNTKYNYAFLLYFKNDLPQSETKINEALALAYSLDGVKLKADILYEQNKLEEAEKYYLQAVYMVPNKMYTKFNAMQFYIKTNQLAKAKYWALAIINMRIKIPSVVIDDLLSNTKILIKKYGW